MDLNQLYFDHQLLLMRARRAASCDIRHDREASAARVAGRIGCIQRSLGAGAAPAWEALATVTGLAAASSAHQQGRAA